MNLKTFAIFAGVFLAGVILSNTVRTKVPFGDKLPNI